MKTDLRRLVLIAVLAIAGCGAPAASQPAASPRIACLGVPATRCDEAVASVARSLPNTSPVSIEVTCVAGPCTAESGAMDTMVTLADGSQLRSTTISWSNPVEPSPGDGSRPPPVPVAPPVVPVAPPVVPANPVCHGVPASMCKTLAETAFGEITDQGVVHIMVRCSEPPCTDDHGIGDTVVTYANGAIRSTTWEYVGS